MTDKWTGVNDGDPWTLEVDTDCFNPDEGPGICVWVSGTSLALAFLSPEQARGVARALMLCAEQTEEARDA